MSVIIPLLIASFVALTNSSWMLTLLETKIDDLDISDHGPWTDQDNHVQIIDAKLSPKMVSFGGTVFSACLVCDLGSVPAM